MAETIMGAIAAPLIGGVVSNLFGGGHASSGAQQAAGAADPFAAQRPQYQTMLSDLMSGKTPFEETAGAKALTQTGMDATSAQMAQRGLSGSGAEKAALTKYATGIAGQDYNSQMSQLMAMAGVGAGSTGTAGQMLGDSAAASQAGRDTFGSTIGKAVTGSEGFQTWLDPLHGATNSPTDMTGFQTSSPSWTGSSAPQQPAMPTMGNGLWDSGGSSNSLTDYGLKF